MRVLALREQQIVNGGGVISRVFGGGPGVACIEDLIERGVLLVGMCTLAPEAALFDVLVLGGSWISSTIEAGLDCASWLESKME